MKRSLVMGGFALAAMLFCLTGNALALGKTDPSKIAHPSASTLPPAVPPSMLDSSRPNRGRSGGLCGGAVYCWDDGLLAQTYLSNDAGIGGVSVVNSYAGYLVSNDGNWPATGDTFWAHIVTAVSVIRTIPLVTGVEYVPPPHSVIALDAAKKFNAGRIRCYWTQYTSNGLGGYTAGTPHDFTGTNDGAGNACLNQPSLSGFGQTLGWSQMVGTLNAYSLFEVVVPLRSSKPLYGIASSSDKMHSRISFNLDAEIYPDAWTIVKQSSISLNARNRSRGLSVAGTVGPVDPLRGAISRSGEGEKLSVRLLATIGGRQRLVSAKELTLNSAGAFSTSISVPRGASRCTVRAIWGGATSAEKKLAC